jgi:hypothetical protein
MHSFLLGLLLMAAAPPAAVPQMPAIERVALLGASKVGEDSSGSLWAWNRDTGKVVRLAVDGRVLGEAVARDARAVDVEPWGVAAVSSFGDRLSILPWAGEGTKAVALDHRVQDVAWLDTRTVAISPLTSARRIEIWDIEKGVRLRDFGAEQALTPAFGATRLRTVLLELDPATGLLYSLEAFTGDLVVFTRDGAVVWRAQVEHPRRSSWDSWLVQVDAKAKAEGDAQTPAIFNWAQFAVGQDGAVWLVQECPQDAPIRLLTVRAGVAQPRTLAPQPCCANSVGGWGDDLIFYRGPRHPGGACASARRLP